MNRLGKRPGAAIAALVLLATTTGCSTEPNVGVPPTITLCRDGESPSDGCVTVDPDLDQSSPTPSTATTLPPPPALSLTKIATLDEPVAVSAIPDRTTLLFAEKKGRVVSLEEDGTAATVVDLRGQVSLGNEQGLLGLAVAPSGRHLYVNLTNRDGDTEIREYPLTGLQAAITRPRLVMRIDQPAPNHNGGHLAFGPDGYLYIGMGDGGGAGDPNNNAQNLGSLLGKLLRIDPTLGSDGPYRPAPGNPYAGRRGARPEIWASGLRNPWRFSFSETSLGHELWIADVGQGEWEEINRVDATWAGRNYGWNLREGSHRFRGDAPDGATEPIYEYDHSGGRCSVTGGVVYRGGYLFADHCDGRVTMLMDDPIRAVSLGLHVDQPTSFGLDGQGRPLVLSRAGPVYRLT